MSSSDRRRHLRVGDKVYAIVNDKHEPTDIGFVMEIGSYIRDTGEPVKYAEVRWKSGDYDTFKIDGKPLDHKWLACKRVKEE